MLREVAQLVERMEARHDPHKREEHTAALRTAGFRMPPAITLFGKLLRSTRLLSQHACELALGMEDAAERTLKSCTDVDRLAKVLGPTSYQYAAERAVAVFFNHGQDPALVEAFFIRIREWAHDHGDAEPSDSQLATIERDLVAAATAARPAPVARYPVGTLAPRAHAAAGAPPRPTPRAGASAAPACLDFQKGSCRRNNCRFSHEKAPRA